MISSGNLLFELISYGVGIVLVSINSESEAMLCSIPPSGLYHFDWVKLRKISVCKGFFLDFYFAFVGFFRAFFGEIYTSMHINTPVF